MQSVVAKRSRWVSVLAIVAVLFGLATIVSGGRTLFDAEVQRQAGNFVAFVLWYNFVAGFVYVIAGIGLWFQQRWSIWLSFAIAAATLLVFAGFGVQIWGGGRYEMRTVIAMGLRAITWLAISAIAYARLASPQRQVTA